MKFSLFLQMEQYDSNKPHRELFDELLELVHIAEAAGFETVWIGEHHSMEFTIGPNPFSFLAYLAPLTKTIRLGTGTCIAPFWHPIRLAGEAALLDVMSNGRLDLGVSRGAYQCEFDRMLNGVSSSDGGQYMREMIPAIQKLWAGDYAHDGELWKFPVSTATPRPVQQPSIPVWIAARDPASHDFAVKNNCNLMVTPLFKPDEEVEELMVKFNTACENNAQVPRPKIMCLRHTFVSEAEEEIEQGLDGIRSWYAHFMSWGSNKSTPVNGFCPPLSEEVLQGMPHLNKSALRENLMVGTPETLVKRLKHYETLGYDEYSFWSDNTLSHEQKKKSLELFIEKVKPAFT